MPRDAVSRTANVGTVGMNGLIAFMRVSDWLTIAGNGSQEPIRCSVAWIDDTYLLLYISCKLKCSGIQRTIHLNNTSKAIGLKMISEGVNNLGFLCMCCNEGFIILFRKSIQG